MQNILFSYLDVLLTMIHALILLMESQPFHDLWMTSTKVSWQL